MAEAAWLASLDYERGARAAVVDPDGAGGNRWDQDDAGTVWPDGEAASRTDPASLLHARYERALAQIEDAALAVRDLVGMLVPVQPGFELKACGTCGSSHPVRLKTRARDMTPVDVASNGWCASCFWDNQHFTPIETASLLRADVSLVRLVHDGA